MCAHVSTDKCAQVCIGVHKCACTIIITYVRKCLRLYVCKCACTSMHKYIRTYAQMYTGMHKCACTSVHKCAQVCTSVHRCACTSVYKCAQVCIGVHKCACTSLHKSTQVRMCAQVCTSMPKCAQLCTSVCKCDELLGLTNRSRMPYTLERGARGSFNDILVMFAAVHMLKCFSMFLRCACCLAMSHNPIE